MAYNPSDHYWLRSDGMLFSSARLAWVDSADTQYKAFADTGSEPTRMPRDADGEESQAELDAVLRAAGVPASAKELAARKPSDPKVSGFAFADAAGLSGVTGEPIAPISA